VGRGEGWRGSGTSQKAGECWPRAYARWNQGGRCGALGRSRADEREAARDWPLVGEARDAAPLLERGRGGARGPCCTPIVA
jgi:hypothetical protein